MTRQRLLGLMGSSDCPVASEASAGGSARAWLVPPRCPTHEDLDADSGDP